MAACHPTMLARMPRVFAQTLQTNPTRSFLAPLRFQISFKLQTRLFYTATGKFTDTESNGHVDTRNVSIRMGEPDEAYVCIPADVGMAFQSRSSALSLAAAAAAAAEAPRKRADKVSLTYFHDSQTFALTESPDSMPRLEIPNRLPRKRGEGNERPATMWLYGYMHTIALDGTFDAEFAEIASTVVPDIGGALKKLRDM